jgi:predicted glutamine amidotransferase
MCELTFVNLHNEGLNRAFTFHAAMENSRIGKPNPYPDNRHGWGMYTTSIGITKSAEVVWNMVGFGKLLKDSIDKTPVIFHTRAASKGSEIKQEFNHPFETEHIVLCHNGTLVPKVALAGYEGKMDTQVFLGELEKEYANSGLISLSYSLTKTMENFTGKFAFLVYDKVHENYYAVRGKTAELSLTYLLNKEMLPTGYVINTSKYDLDTEMNLVSEMYGLAGNKTPVFSKIEELETESIYLLEDKLPKKIAEIKQNYPEVAVVKTSYKAPRASVISAVRGGDMQKLADFLYCWTASYGLSIEELDSIFLESLGVGIMQSQPSDIQTFKKYLVPKLVCPKGFREECKKYLRKLPRAAIQLLYEENKFQFPYMLEPRKEDFLAKLKEKVKILNPLEGD